MYRKLLPFFCDRNVGLKTVVNWDLMMIGEQQRWMELKIFILHIHLIGVLVTDNMRYWSLLTLC